MSIASAGARAGDRRRRTRLALVDSAFQLVCERGFTAVSLDDIAARAGMTKGAIYSNFKSRSELLLAMCEAKAPTLRPRFEPGKRLRVQLRACAEALIDDLLADPGRARFMIEYHRHAQEDAVFGQALQGRYDAMFATMGRYFDDCPDRLTLPGHALAVMTQALLVGLVEQWRLTPSEVTPAVIRQALETLADGAVARRAPASVSRPARSWSPRA